MSNTNELVIKNPKLFHNLGREETTEIKGVAILMIIFLHVSTRLFLVPNSSHGEFGVDIFVILSGFGLTLSYLSKRTSIMHFVKSRLSKIFPLYWLVLGIIMLTNIYYIKAPLNIKDYVFHFLGLHAFTSEYFYSISDPFWYISLILTLYILFIISMRFIISKNINALLIIGLASSISSVYLFHLTNNINGEIFFSSRILGFFIGIVLALMIKEGAINLKLNITLSSLVLIQVILIFNQGIPFNYPIAGLLIITVYLNIILKFNNQLIDYLRKVLHKIGEYSYEIYLTHYFLMMTLNTHILIKIGMPNLGKGYLVVEVLLVFLVTIVVSMFISKIVKYISTIFKTKSSKRNKKVPFPLQR